MKAQILYQTVGFVGVRSFGVAVGREMRQRRPAVWATALLKTHHRDTGSRWVSSLRSFARRRVEEEDGATGLCTSDAAQSFLLQANLGSCIIWAGR